MTKLRKVLLAAFLALWLTPLAGTTAEASKGIEWCVKDPIFEIDGRIVRVVAFAPAEHAASPTHLVLRVARGSSVTWYVPDGETFVGTVTVEHVDAIGRDTPLLDVRGEGGTYPMLVAVSGTGLRRDAYELRGTSVGYTVPVRLVRLGR